MNSKMKDIIAIIIIWLIALSLLYIAISKAEIFINR